MVWPTLGLRMAKERIERKKGELLGSGHGMVYIFYLSIFVID